MKNLTTNLLFIFIVHVLSNHECSVTYLAPAFEMNFGCINALDKPVKDCNPLISSTLTLCGSKVVRNLVTIFDFNLNTIFTCPTDSINVICGNNNTSSDFCPDELTNLKFSESNFLETRIINYTHQTDLLGQLEKICDFKPKDYPPPPNYPPVKPFPVVPVLMICGVVFGLIVVWIVFWITRVKRRWNESKIEAFADEHSKSRKHILFGKYKDEWEVTPKELKVDARTILGQGMFGKVYLGHLKKQRNKEWIEMDVAVKFTHETSNEKMRQEMIEEIGFMKKMGDHPNLLVMVGYVKSIENPVICTVFCSNGSLLSVIKKHELHFMSKEKCHDVEICLLLPDLLRIAIEVCDGLIYLSSFNYVHRDIAARNVLLTENMTAKLADFGLCKQLGEHEISILDKESKLPVKYVPFESLRFFEFSFKTDVWAFGILLFEMFSGGQVPFKEIDLKDFVRHLDNDGKPTMPENTPEPLVNLLNEKVFQKYPSRRADFKELRKELSSFCSIVSNVLLVERNSSRNGSFRSAKSFNNV